jgi:hypothetical protein
MVVYVDIALIRYLALLSHFFFSAIPLHSFAICYDTLIDYLTVGIPSMSVKSIIPPLPKSCYLTLKPVGRSSELRLSVTKCLADPKGLRI